MAFGVYLPTPAVQSSVLGYFEALALFILPVTLVFSLLVVGG